MLVLQQSLGRNLLRCPLSAQQNLRLIYAEEEMESDGDEDVYALLNRAASLASTRQARLPRLPLACCRVRPPPAPHVWPVPAPSPGRACAAPGAATMACSA